jgi:pyrimidine-nucleoside phosphorylase
MVFSEIIRKKRDGFALTKKEIDAAVCGYTRGTVPDYQMAALLMAVVLKGMDEEETLHLTRSMLHSGTTFDLSKIDGKKIDKHSTGGVGDKISLILAPLVASCGVIVPMISGRGLGHTGGTLDKLESIRGFRTDLSLDQFLSLLEKNGVAMMGQTEEIAPADRKIYSLRDVTATVESIPLITASILSKKLAEGADGLVLDVKCGKGAFMRSADDAEALASSMTTVVKGFGKKCISLITNMDQPLGKYVGNSLEVVESIECLKGNGPDDLMEVTFALGREMIIMAEKAVDGATAQSMLEDAIASGKALERFRNVVELQGGDPRVVDDYSLLPQSKNRTEIKAERSGYISKIDCYEVGVVNLMLGGGRKRKEDSIDPGVGIVFRKKVGETVEKEESFAVLHHDDDLDKETVERFISSVTIIDERPSPLPLLLGRIA